jgi:Ferredoxin
MPRPEYHVFICAQQRPENHPRGSCSQKGAGKLMNKFSQAIMSKKLMDKVQIVATGCIGPCQAGANVLVYPEATMYSLVDENDVNEIVDQHFIEGKPVEAKFAPSEIW